MHGMGEGATLDGIRITPTCMGSGGGTDMQLIPSELKYLKGKYDNWGLWARP